MNKIPASIKEKKLIKKYADIYLKCKDVIKEYFDKQNQIDSLGQSHQILLLITLVMLIENMNDKTIIPSKIKIILNSNGYSEDPKGYIIWNWLCSFIVNDDDYSFSSGIIKQRWNIAPMPNEILIKVSHLLNEMRIDNEFHNLLPYILEVFEYENIDLKTAIFDERRGTIPLKKKKRGIYYTPDDVASYIISNTVERFVEFGIFKSDDNDLKSVTILDPSCGTGIFLKKSLVYLIEKYRILNFTCPLSEALMNNIYGVDKSPTAIRSCIMILLATDIKMLMNSNLSIFTLWNIASMNVLEGDSVNGTLPIDIPSDNGFFEETLINRIELKNTILVDYFDFLGKEELFNNRLEDYKRENSLISSFYYSLCYPEVFQSKNLGFACIVGNPPYTDYYAKENFDLTHYVSYGGNIYTLFVENMKFLSGKDSICSLIIPLSISYHTGQGYKKLRKMVKEDSAVWGFNHFDRSPDSLFGDDIKTRNSIIFRESFDIMNKRLYTSTLLRWNSRNRDKLFENIETIDISDFNIIEFIPKISSELELEILKKLLEKSKSLFEMVNSVPKKHFYIEGDFNKNIYFYSTAYNWIPIFMTIPKSYDKEGNITIPDSLWGVECSSSNDARFIFACISSTVSYWLWAVIGDGFHLSSQFLKKLPFNKSLFSESSFNRLACLGEKLWNELQKHPINKVNSGKSIGNYNFLSCRAIIEDIDNIIIQEMGLPLETSSFIHGWYRDMIQAGRDEFKNAKFLKV